MKDLVDCYQIHDTTTFHRSNKMLQLLRQPKIVASVVFGAFVIAGLIAYFAATTSSSSSYIGQFRGECVKEGNYSIAPMTLGNGDFAGRFYRSVTAQMGKHENMVVSPMSAAAVVALASVGAGGNTLSEILSALSLPCSEQTLLDGFKSLMGHLQQRTNNVSLSMANKMFVNSDYAIAEEFRLKAAEYFRATPETVDFTRAEATARKINDWVEQQTGSKIKDIIQPGSVSESLRVILVNAIYFKGSWSSPFNELLTEREAFHGSLSMTRVPMMHKEDFFHLGYSVELKARILKLPYLGKTVAMYLVLPNNTTTLDEVADRMDFGDPDRYLEQQKTHVSLVLPRFKLETRLELNKALERLGAAEMFLPVADFSRMLLKADNNVHISEVVQKTFIEVNEQGTEAAAATGINFRSFAGDPVVFACDHPFMYLIRDNVAGVTLFAGRFVQAVQQ